MDTDMIWEMILKVVKNINIVAYKKYAIFLEIIFLFKKTAPIKGLLIKYLIFFNIHEKIKLNCKDTIFFQNKTVAINKAVCRVDGFFGKIALFLR